MSYNYSKAKQIQEKNVQRILSVNKNIPNTSGIYFLYRFDDGFKYAYVGQSVTLLTRLASHLSGYQHIDLSIKKHGLYSDENNTGWQIDFLEIPVDKLDEAEQHYIKEMANKGYQMRNKTGGSQGSGKHGISDNKPPKGYRDGIEQGYRNARKEIGHLFELHLEVRTKSDNPSKVQLKALEKFKDFIEK